MMRAAIGIYEHPDFTLPKPSSAKQDAQSKLAVVGVLALISSTVAAMFYVVWNPDVQDSLKAKYMKH